MSRRPMNMHIAAVVAAVGTSADDHDIYLYTCIACRTALVIIFGSPDTSTFRVSSDTPHGINQFECPKMSKNVQKCSWGVRVSPDGEISSVVWSTCK